MMAGARARIALISAGGTIVSLADDPFDTVNYPEKSRKIEAQDLLAALPQVAQLADIVPISYRAVSSSQIGWPDWCMLLGQIEALEAQGFDGVVITHGTGTLEETACFLRLTYHGAMPVVLTGAQRPLSALGSDAAGNLVGAVVTAAAPQSRGRGVLVALSGEIHSAGAVTKTDTASLEAFRSPRRGPLGHTQGQYVRYQSAAMPPQAGPGLCAAQRQLPAPRIEIIYAAAGADGLLARAALEAVADQGGGLVFAGFAPGLVTPAQTQVMIQATKQGVPVVMASRTLSSAIFDRSFLNEAGVIPAGEFNPHKARILLALCMLNQATPKQTRLWFDMPL